MTARKIPKSLKPHVALPNILSLEDLIPNLHVGKHMTTRYTDVIHPLDNITINKTVSQVHTRGLSHSKHTVVLGQYLFVLYNNLFYYSFFFYLLLLRYDIHVRHICRHLRYFNERSLFHNVVRNAK